MGKIIYKPHCSNCGMSISAKVEYRSIKINKPDNMIDSINDYTVVYPNRCSYCGEPFNGIEIPMSEELPPDHLYR